MDARRANSHHRFVWGVSTSSYQIEGAVAEDGRGPSIWDIYCRQPGRIANGDTGDVACDHYHRYAEDIGWMRDLGINAYRFSVAWPRVMPRGRGEMNEAGLAFYDRLIDALIAAEIEPWLCLYQWDLPQALQDLGGWTNRDSAQWFGEYATLIARRYGDRVTRYATFNEPSVFALFGYCLGGSAPGISDHASLLRVIHHVNLAHGAAVDRLRADVLDASVGAIHNCQPCRAGGSDPRDFVAAQTLDVYWNGAFPDPQLLGRYPLPLADAMAPYVEPEDLALICRPVDWFGLNHYSPHYVVANPDKPLGHWFRAAASRCTSLEHGLAGRAGRFPANTHRSPPALSPAHLRARKRHGPCRYARRQGRGDGPTADRFSARLHRCNVCRNRRGRRHPWLFRLVAPRQVQSTIWPRLCGLRYAAKNPEGIFPLVFSANREQQEYVGPP
jgi:beta-glucosidase